jgi:penicillin-binding protein 2
MNNRGRVYYNILRLVVVGVGFVLLARLMWLQLNSEEYKEKARSNSIESVVEFPMRGEVLDRNGEYIVKSRSCYDVMIIYKELPKEGFDTARLIGILDI